MKLISHITIVHCIWREFTQSYLDLTGLPHNVATLRHVIDLVLLVMHALCGPTSHNPTWLMYLVAMFGYKVSLKLSDGRLQFCMWQETKISVEHMHYLSQSKTGSFTLKQSNCSKYDLKDVMIQASYFATVLHAGDCAQVSPCILWLISLTVAVLLVVCCDGWPALSSSLELSPQPCLTSIYGGNNIKCG